MVATSSDSMVWKVKSRLSHFYGFAFSYTMIGFGCNSGFDSAFFHVAITRASKRS